MHKSPIRHGHITITKGVSKLLKTKSIIMSRHVSLDKIVEFTLHMNNTARFVACEETFKV
jgi:hypothetical protein